MTPASRTPRHFALMPAGGTGSRVGGALPKQYLDLGGEPMIVRTARALLAVDWIESLLVVVAPGDRHAAGALAGLARTRVAAEGGATRRDTVLAGLQALRRGFDAADDDWVLVHDAARPALGTDALERLREALSDDPVGGLLALPVSDTVKRAHAPDPRAAHAAVAETLLERDRLWLAQTPQMFRLGVLHDALLRFPEVTDEASAIERAGLAPRLVAGERGNFKVTTPDDLEAMRKAIDMTANTRAMQATDDRASRSTLRIGQGYDVHALVPGRPLILGGVRIGHTHGLLGHSDADVLLHAITDALFGAAGLGDIGRHFPDTDAGFAGADSAALLREANARIGAAGYRIVNIDATVVAQAPRLAPHIAEMNASIAAALGLEPARVNVKAKTNERLGFTGRGEGIAAEAVALIEQRAGGPVDGLEQVG